MELVADLIRSNDNGTTLERVDLNSLNGLVGARLFQVMVRVQNELTDANHIQTVNDASSNPYLTRGAYESVLRKSLKDATMDQSPFLAFAAAPGTAPAIHVKRGAFVPSTWVPSLNNWDDVDGAAAELEILDATTGKGHSDLASLAPIADLPLFYLNIRPKSRNLSTSCVYSVPACGKASADGVALIFAPTRTQLESVELAERHGCEQRERVRNVRQWGAQIVGFGGRLTPVDDAIDFRIRFIGDPPHLRASTLLFEDGPEIPEAPPRKEPGDPFPVPPACGSTATAHRLESYRYGFADALEHRRSLVSTKQTHQADHEFFFLLDQATHPESPTIQDKIAHPKPGTFDFLRLGAALSSRYKRRAQHAHFGTDLELGQELIDSQIDEAKAAGELIRQLLYNSFGEDGRCHHDKTAAAFERFAGGELILFDTHGAPNGTNFFSFAELALFLVEAGVDVEEWSRLFVIFGRAAEIFSVSYHGCRQARTVCSYRVANNPQGYRAPNREFKDDVAALWSHGAAPRRYGQLLQAALRDDLEAAFGPGNAAGTIALTDQGC